MLAIRLRRTGSKKRPFFRVVVTEQRLHQLIRQQAPIADRQFEIQFLDPGVEAFSFTFG